MLQASFPIVSDDSSCSTEHLRRRVAELERENRVLAAFAADVAHDLRAPLQVVAGFAELLAERAGDRLDETSQRFVCQILSATGGMQALVETVLEHRRCSSGVLKPTWVNGNDLADAVLWGLQNDLERHGATVDVGDLPTVFADRVQLGRVLQNLLDNAIHSGAGEEPPRIALTARRHNAAWEFAVTDNGFGVRPEDRHRIFDLFQRGGDAERPAGGHGIGLAICRAIVERHGGRIGVERAPGGGARFAFTIPDPSPADLS